MHKTNEIFNLCLDEKLSIENSKLINDRSEVVINEFDYIIEKIVYKSELSKFSLFLNITSRNPISNKLLDIMSRLDLLDQKIKNGEKFNVINVDCHEIAYAVNHFLKKNQLLDVRVQVKNNFKKSFFSAAYRATINFYLLLNSFVWSRFALIKYKPDKPAIFLDTFLLKNSFSSGNKFVDRYYTGFESFIPNSTLRKVWYAPTINGLRTPFEFISTFYKIKKSNENFLIQEAWLKMSDYLKAFFYSFLLPWQVKLKCPDYLGFDLTKIVNKILMEDFGSYELSKSICKYLFIRRLSKSNIQFERIIDWNENQNIDRATNMAFHYYYPKLNVIGYQGYFSSRYESHKHPKSFEIKLNTIPDELQVITHYEINKKLEICNELVVKLSIPFRFSYLLENQRYSKIVNETFTVLVALPITLSDAKQIIDLCISLNKLVPQKKMQFILKHHPVYSKEVYYKNLPLSEQSLFLKNDDNFSSLLNQASMVLSYSSSVCVEAVSKGIPVAVYGNRFGITNNVIPSEYENEMWRIIYSAEDFENFIKNCRSVKNTDTKSIFGVPTDLKFYNIFTSK
jgi:hypothetical protein